MQSTEARTEAQRLFASKLEVWLASLLPSEERWSGRWYDGLLIDEFHFENEQKITLRGRVYRLEPQRLYPFEARLTLGNGELSNYEVLFGNRDDPDDYLARSAKTSAHVGTWSFRFSK